MIFLEAVRRRDGLETDGAFPWSVPAFASFESLRLRAPVTLFVGENGSGKSTFLEALAVAVDAVAIAGRSTAGEPTLAGARTFAQGLVVARRGRPRARVLFRAEDAFGFTRRVEREMRELREEAARLRADESASPAARERAAGYVLAQAASLAASYGADPHAFSHGETFLGILRKRIAPGGLYLLDEPETPLSPTRVLALMALVDASVRRGSQFVIATHSPILAAFPNASIVSFDEGRIRPVAFADLEHVRVTREFLAAPERYLRHVLGDGETGA